jgi:hypothetical protein
VKFRIPINKRQWLTVEVWPTHEEYLEGTAKWYGRSHPKRVASYAVHGKRKKRTGEFGVMLFSQDRIGAGTVAHEVQHFIFDWIVEHIKKLDWKHDEPLAQLADKVNSTFWRKYYKRVPARVRE